MKGKPGPPSILLRPILDTYADSAVALVGCTSRGLDRYSCEMDVLIVTNDRRPPTALKIGDVYADVLFVPEKEVLRPSNPEHSLSLANLKPVRDTSLILSTGSAASLATFSESAARASRARLASALKTLGRADVALAHGLLVDADFCLLAASYELAYAWLISREAVPSPSHLLMQLGQSSKGESSRFEAFSAGTGLEAAGRAGCGARLEGLTVLHDLLREGSKSATAESRWSDARTGILGSKAKELIQRIELAECFSFLGQELVDSLIAVLRQHPRSTLHSLTSGDDVLLGERLIRQVGLARDEKAVRAGLEQVKAQVSSLAKA